MSTPDTTWLTATQAAAHANQWRHIASGGRAATVGLTAICNWNARGHLQHAGLDDRGHRLYRLADVARAEQATRARALRLVGIGAAPYRETRPGPEPPHYPGPQTPASSPPVRKAIAMPTTRAKFRCTSVEQSSDQPAEVQRYVGAGEAPATYPTWPRTFRFSAVYDQSVPEDQRYAQATPSGSLTMQVDNPAVMFKPGADYYLDITPTDEN
jgi:hypothetical protein